LTKINFSKFSICKWHLSNLIKIIVKEEILSLFICNPTIPKICQAKNPIVRNIASCFCHHWRGDLMSLTSNWYLLKIRSSLLTSSSIGSLVLTIYSNISKLQSSSKIFWLVEFLFDLTKGCKCSWHLTNIRYKDFLSYSSTRATHCSFQQMRILYEGPYT